MNRIFLIGYMGAGKTTLGKALARDALLEFIDLDWYIENRFHRSIADIFGTMGEDRFRRMEQAMLHEVGEFEDVVISCGGGTPCFFDNMDYMNLQGKTVLLEADLTVLLRRLTISRHKRPILEGKTEDELRDFVTSALEERSAFYGKARYRMDSSRLESVGEIAQTVAEARKLLDIQ